MKRYLFILSLPLWISACQTQPQNAPAAMNIENQNINPPLVRLRLIETTDIHAHGMGYDYFRNQVNQEIGLEYLAPMIAAARTEVEGTVLIDNGDLIQGAPLGDYVAERDLEALATDGHPLINALNVLGVDLANLGNHEFNFGLPFLHATYQHAEFPVISSNMQLLGREAKASKIKSNALLERVLTDQEGREHRIQLGVFGVLPPQIMVWDKNHLEGKVTVQDIVISAREQVKLLQQQGADVIIAVAHSGINFHASQHLQAEQAVYQLAQVAGIDAIMFGHQHRVFPGDASYDDLPYIDNNSGHIYGIPAVQPGYYGSHLGIIDLDLIATEQGWQVNNSQVQVRATKDFKEAHTYPVQQQVINALAESHQGTIDYLDAPIGTTQVALSNQDARLQPASAVQFIQQAQLWYAQQRQDEGLLPALPLLSAAAPFKAGVYEDTEATYISAGEVRLRDIADLYPFPNTLQVIELTGAQVKDWLEMSARSFKRPTISEPDAIASAVQSYNADSIFGLTYRVNPEQPAVFNAAGERINPSSQRVFDLRYQGQRVKPEQRFLVISNNYRATGGGQFPHLDGSLSVYEGTQEVRAILADYIKSFGENGYDAKIEAFWQLEVIQ